MGKKSMKVCAASSVLVFIACCGSSDEPSPTATHVEPVSELGGLAEAPVEPRGPAPPGSDDLEQVAAAMEQSANNLRDMIEAIDEIVISAMELYKSLLAGPKAEDRKTETAAVETEGGPPASPPASEAETGAKKAEAPSPAGQPAVPEPAKDE